MRKLRAKEGVSAVVAIILLVAITVVLTGFLYLIVTDIANNQAEVPPRVLLTEVSTNPEVFRVSVAQVRPLVEFQIRLWIDGSLDGASIMNPVAQGTRGNVTFTDFDGGGGMSDGDLVTVQDVAGRGYEVFLLWKGNVVHDVTWQT